MVTTLFHIVDMLLVAVVIILGLYLLVFTLASLKSSNRRFPNANERTRFLVLIPNGSVFTAQLYPEELYRVECYTNIVNSVKLADESAYDMCVILGETTQVSPHFLKYLNNAYCNNARAIKIRHMIKGKIPRREHLAAIYEGVQHTVMALGHNKMNMSSHLGREDMAIDMAWLKQNMVSEKANIENRMLHQGVFIHYMPYAVVFSEHPRAVCRDSFSFKKLFTILPGILAEGNSNYADKLVRNAFPSWHVVMRLMLIWALVCTYWQWVDSLKWWLLLMVYFFLLALAVPDYIVLHGKKRKVLGIEIMKLKFGK